MYIDTPTANTNYIKSNQSEILVQGWAVSNDGNAYIEYYLDNQKINCISMRVPRPDVTRAISPSYGGTAKTPLPGFVLIFKTNNLSSGNHIIEVREISKTGQVIATARTNFYFQDNITVKGELCIDSPITNETFTKIEQANFKIRGWAVSNDKDSQVKVLIDGTQISNVNRVLRTDVDQIISPSYGGAENTPKAGFECFCDINNLSIGNHRITVNEYSKFGKIIASRRS